MPNRSSKRPRDVNALAKLIADVATGQVELPKTDEGKDPAAVARLVAPQFAALRSQINDPAYDCIRTVPLPREYLDGLRRPGGSAAAPDR